jgi:hypothetical protein
MSLWKANMRAKRNKTSENLPIDEPAEDTVEPMASELVVSGGEGRWQLTGHARSIHVEAGLHALIVGKTDAQRHDIADVALPVTQITPRPDERPTVTIVSNSSGDSNWLGAEGGTVILRAQARAAVFVATYGIADEAALPVLKMLDLNRLDGAQPDSPTPAPVAASGSPGRDITSELILHIERQGDRRFSAGGWAGNPGGRLRIEGFAIRPLSAIAPGQVEYMGFGPGGRQTPWVTDVKLCGTRGRGFPLTGFAVRVAPALRAQFDVVYEGYFFDSGIRGPVRNGEPCLPSIVDDPLGAIRLRVIERLGA